MSAAPKTRELYPPRRADPEMVNLYASLLRGRRVVIVGPATTICGSGQKERIDSYDLVVRINNQWPPQPERIPDIGSRGDILYHCCNGKSPVALLETPGFERFRFAWYESNCESTGLAALCARNNIPSACYDELQDELIDKLGTVPNTGLLAIVHLLSSELSELYVTGFSFHATRYYHGYIAKGARPKYWRWWRRRDRIGLHHFEPQRAFFRTLAERDSRLCVDAPLQRLLQHW
jgi:hypothetical protein